MDVTALIPWIVPVVTAAAPHMLTLGQTAAEKAFEKIAESVGEDTWKWGKPTFFKALAKLWPKVEANPLALAAAKEVAQAPANPDNQQLLVLALRKLLENDQALAAELESLRAAAQPGVTQTGSRNIVSTGDQNILVTGDGNTIQR